MPYAVVEDIAASWEQYERFGAALEGPPAPTGLILHVAGPTDEGFRIIGIWESEAAWLRFLADRLNAAVAAYSTHAQPVLRALQPAHVVYGRKENEECSAAESD